VASHDITVDEMAKSILKNANIYEENVAFLLSKKGKVISSNSQQFMKEIQEQSKEGYRGDFYYRTLLNADKDNIKNITVSNYDYLNKLGDEIISKIEHTKNVSTQRWKSSIPFFDDKLLFVSQIPASAWTLVYYVPKKSILSKAQSIFYETLFILAIFITLLFVVSAFLTMRHLITPLDIINKASQRFGDGFTDVEVQYSNQNLLKILFHTFNTMVKKVNFNQQLLEKKVSERTKELQEEITLRKTVEDELRLISRTDTMTGIWNRGYFFEMLEREINRSHRFNSNMTLLMIDIDFFKNINDTYGHNVGDKAIKHLTKLISLSIRKENIFGRLGGEEFGIILIETEEPDTHRNIAERIRKSVENNPLIINNTPLSITISVGISTLRNDDNTNTLYIRSDEALYLAKEKGRNRIEEV
jgi:diguanylate cyclase (GGDEF)-like protein